MMSQPSLELDNPLINRLRDAECSRLCGSTFDQEANEPTYPAHVLGGEEMMLTGATTLASMSCKQCGDAIIDVNNCDPTSAQPLSKVTGRGFVACHCQSRAPKGLHLTGERFHKRPQYAGIHTLATWS